MLDKPTFSLIVSDVLHSFKCFEILSRRVWPGCDVGLEALGAPNSHLMAVLNCISAAPAENRKGSGRPASGARLTLA